MSEPDSQTEETIYAAGLVPLIIGVTGHRDLVPAELPGIRTAVHSFLSGLQQQFPDRPVQVLSPLAAGADRLVAEVALELGMKIIVSLPMPEDLYIKDFDTADLLQEFYRLRGEAEAVYELPIVPGSTREQISNYTKHRDYQYAQLGVFLGAHSHVLLALWDGKQSSDLGGTAQVVEFRRDDVMRGYEPTEQLNSQLLTEDESDLVYHIVVSRDRENGAPESGLVPMLGQWLTISESQPRQSALSETYVKVFERTSEFNREARAHQKEIEEESYPLINKEDAALLPEVTRTIHRLFCAADWLAIHYQAKRMTSLRVTHSLAFLMGMVFLFYADFEARRLFVLVFFACFMLAFVIHNYSARQQWHAKYLEYRTLAEGLRVQFYWAAAGVTTEMITKFSHENFLQKQDIELGWIRNVMRVASIGCDIAPNLDPQGVEIVVREWVGDADEGGQLRYYSTKKSTYRERAQRIDSLANLTSIVVGIILVLCVIVSSDATRTTLFLALGAMLLLFGVRQAYAFQVAEKDVIKQYEFMHSIFATAERRIRRASSDTEKRRILRVLGEAALDEHAQWIFLHRDRPADAAGFLRMES
ncbi:MAG TPA: hypothetical protein VKQ06_07825 [Gammaproteobacteria bacterium]|nr:hypothetical protein [Gammaproteobacteria bacterium]